MLKWFSDNGCEYGIVTILMSLMSCVTWKQTSHQRPKVGFVL